MFATRLWNMPLGPAAPAKTCLLGWAGLGQAGPGWAKRPKRPRAASGCLGLAKFLPLAALAAPAVTAAGQAQRLAS